VARENRRRSLLWCMAWWRLIHAVASMSISLSPRRWSDRPVFRGGTR
jgi:hypothetical protein